MWNRLRFSRIASAIPLLTVLAAPALGEEKAAQLVPLVQLQGYEFICERVGSLGFGGRYCQEGTAQERSITIFRSGRVISIRTATNRTSREPGNVAFTPLPSVVKEFQATRRAVVDLIAFLGAEGISRRHGPCNPLPASSTDPTGELSFARYSIVWFQADGSRSYTVLDDRSTNACPPQIHAIFDSIVTFGEGGR
jgi:hypothetical protein